MSYLEVIQHADSDIVDESGKILGKLIGKGTLRKKTILVDAQGNELLVIKKATLPYDCYEILDQKGNFLGKAEARNGGKLVMNDSNNKTILEEDDAKGLLFVIHDNLGKTVATLSEHLKQEDLKGVFSGKVVFHLQIENHSLNRELLLGFCISCFSKRFDYYSGPTG